MLKLFKSLFIFLFTLSLNAQIPIEFYNPSFEGTPRKGRLKANTYLSGWSDCAHNEFPEESSFDIQSGFFEVETAPVDGNTFVGLITRANGSYESICQELYELIVKDSTYQFSIYLAKSEEYESPTRASFEEVKKQSAKKIDEKGRKRKKRKKREKANESNQDNRAEIVYKQFNENTILKVYGGIDKCSKDELLFTSKEISHNNWKEYIIEFVSPSNNIKFISFEAYFPDDSVFTRGNLMIDYISNGLKE